LTTESCETEAAVAKSAAAKAAAPKNPPSVGAPSASTYESHAYSTAHSVTHTNAALTFTTKDDSDTPASIEDEEDGRDRVNGSPSFVAPCDAP
jgi:hypothetical protein